MSRPRPVRSWTPSRYYDGNYRLRLREQIVVELAGTAQRILDLGSGNASIARAIPHESITAVDCSPAMLRLARMDPTVQAVESDLRDFTDSEPYDLVLCLGVLAHVEDDLAVLRAIARNLSPTGRAIIQLSDRAQPLNWLWWGRYRATSRRGLLRAAAHMGLRPVEERQHLLLVPGLSRLLGRRLLDYDEWVQRSPLAAFGTNHIILLRREWPTATVA